MINAFIACLVVVFSFQTFLLTYRLNGVNRTMISMPRGLIESAIPIIQDDEYVAYFDQEKLESNVKDYFSKTLYKYTSNYGLSFYYYSNDDKLICKTNYCDGVRITLEAEIVFSYRYHKTMFYQIEEH